MFDARQLLNSLLGGDAANNISNTAAGAVQDGRQMADQAGSAVAGALAQAGKQFEGTQAGDLLNQASKLAGANTLATTAGLAGLAALLLGTSTGRASAGSAVKLGGIGLLGGLAYKAFSNYQAGKPLTAGIPMLDDASAPNDISAPATTGYAPDDHSHDTALLLLRTMVAAASADGYVDPSEREKIAAQVHGLGLDGAAAAFLEGEMKSPASAADIAAAIGDNKELAVQAYTMARAVTGRLTGPEHTFLQSLAQGMKLDPTLVSHIDAAVMEQLT